MATLSYTPVSNNAFLNFGDNVLYRNDDGYSDPIDITSIFEDGITIGDVTYTTLYVNNNGNVTFGSGLTTFTPNVIGGTTGLNIIAPFWADVDTREDVPNTNDGVFWDFKEGRDSIVFTWYETGYYSYHIDKLNSFQLELRDRGAGNVEIIFRYSDVEWTTGDASGGSGGMGGTVARAGFTLGGTYFELPASGNQSSILSLENNVGNLGVAGVWQFLLQDGTPSGFGTTDDNEFIGTARRDIWFGLEGNDTAWGRGTGDVLYGNAGADRLYGEAGADRLYGDQGNDKLYGGGGRDLLNGGMGNDVMDGGADKDTAEFLSSSRQTVTVRLDLGTASGMGTDTLISIENAQTGAGADALTGNGGANTLNAGRGADVLDGKGGADRLIGGGGNDTQTGGGGADRFVFNRGDGSDVINDFENGSDQIEIDSGAAGFGNVTVADEGADVRISFANVQIVLKGLDHTLIDAGDFIFA